MLKLISQRNCAPSLEDPKHDVYAFSVDTSGTDKPFCFEQSLTGGHAERGGCIFLNLAELEQCPGDWRVHLEKSGCGWVAELMAGAQTDQQAVKLILDRVSTL
ncbi:hypothetical protein [Pseudomonas syringae group genomosp. 3]|uniref:Uncharacterized protein n=2 Tax=Pseudomonas syringae group genomosp. 3 TaxID=251701 RepID=A0A0N8RFG2_9PSED|nr:hypothetical protein [Pseudomonas syringae group genomosp. 3]KPW60562.1 Uncharacterized protein ALO86_04560 [Pseudomonas syringae pv. berberidis]KPX23103.1 hypothetical protein ALO72_100426 [Pseudomonas syringae pv. delphinii]KPY28323.1 Uncharacterized protein ALO54_02016 [Pseudomonas syringae pv. philadelphi]KPZ10184.1 Uncharacterized protein ALO40_00528 [Pseudomonas syringae pv. viburni]RMM16726.1 hypothetical protein ALQ83_01707 [Pseudomonas syringae pv. berberidis]